MSPVAFLVEVVLGVQVGGPLFAGEPQNGLCGRRMGTPKCVDRQLVLRACRATPPGREKIVEPTRCASDGPFSGDDLVVPRESRVGKVVDKLRVVNHLTN